MGLTINFENFLICKNNGILLSHKKEPIWVISSEVDEVSQKEKQALYTDNLESGTDEPIWRAGIEMQT